MLSGAVRGADRGGDAAVRAGVSAPGRSCCPGWALALAMPASAFQAPLWTFYRRLDYLTPAPAAGVGPGRRAGGDAGARRRRPRLLGVRDRHDLRRVGGGRGRRAGVAVQAARWRYERGTVREYATFSGPLMFKGACIAVIALGPVLVAQRSLGTAAVGAMAIANNISVYANKVDQVVTNTHLSGHLRGEGPARPAGGGVPEVEPDRPAVGRADGARRSRSSRPTSCTSCSASRWEIAIPLHPVVRPGRRAQPDRLQLDGVLPRPRRHAADRGGRGGAGRWRSASSPCRCCSSRAWTASRSA